MRADSLFALSPGLVSPELCPDSAGNRKRPNFFSVSCWSELFPLGSVPFSVAAGPDETWRRWKGGHKDSVAQRLGKKQGTGRSDTPALQPDCKLGQQTKVLGCFPSHLLVFLKHRGLCLPCGMVSSSSSYLSGFFRCGIGIWSWRVQKAFVSGFWADEAGSYFFVHFFFLE